MFWYITGEIRKSGVLEANILIFCRTCLCKLQPELIIIFKMFTFSVGTLFNFFLAVHTFWPITAAIRRILAANLVCLSATINLWQNLCVSKYREVPIERPNFPRQRISTPSIKVRVYQVCFIVHRVTQTKMIFVIQMAFKLCSFFYKISPCSKFVCKTTVTPQYKQVICKRTLFF